jgi:hypothetical protein
MLRINDEKEKKKKKSLFKKSFVCLVFFCLRRNNNNTRFGRAAISRRRRGVPKWFYDSFSPIPANIVDTILYRARPPYIWAPLKKKKKKKKYLIFCRCPSDCWETISFLFKKEEEETAKFREP